MRVCEAADLDQKVRKKIILGIRNSQTNLSTNRSNISKKRLLLAIGFCLTRHGKPVTSHSEIFVF